MSYGSQITPGMAQAVNQAVSSSMRFPDAIKEGTPATLTPPVPVQPAATPQPTGDVLQNSGASVEFPNFEETVEAPPVEENVEVPPVQDDIETELEDTPESPARENFKKLQSAARKAREDAKVAAAEAAEYKAKVEKYEKGEIKPEILQALHTRNAELETYEKAFNLKMSPEYQDEIVKPSTAATNKLYKFADDYGIPRELMSQAVGIENKRDRNQFLSQHFDDVGALEVKQVIEELHSIGEKALEYDKLPAESLKSLQDKYKAREVELANKRATVFENTAKDAWQKALDKTRQEGVYRELILSETDPEHNEKVVTPIQAKAATQFGALVKQLAKAGIKELPDDLAVGLARMVQLSIGGAMALNDRDKAQNQAKKIKETSQRLTPFIRPQIGGTVGAAHTHKAPAERAGPVTPREAAKGLKFPGM